jgi:hypothetical protein
LAFKSSKDRLLGDEVARERNDGKGYCVKCHARHEVWSPTLQQKIRVICDFHFKASKEHIKTENDSKLGCPKSELVRMVTRLEIKHWSWSEMSYFWCMHSFLAV